MIKGNKDTETEREILLSIFDNINDVIYISDPETYELLHINKAVEENWGTGIIGTKCFKALQGRDEPCPFCTNDKIFGENTGKPYVWEFQNEVNGKWFRCTDKAIKWVDGRMVRFELATDITERKLLEINIVERVKELKFFHEVGELLNTPDIEYKKAFQIIVDKLPDACHLPENTCARIVVEELEFRNEFYRESNTTVKNPIVLNNKEIGFVELCNTKTRDEYNFITEEIDLVKSLTNLISNFVKRKNYEEMLYESEQKFRSFFENTVIGKSITGLDGSLQINDAFAEMLGYTREELLNKNWKEITHPADISVSEHGIKDMLDGKIESVRIDKRYYHKNGNVVWTDVSTTLFRNKKGEAKHFITAILDITDRKNYEKEQKQLLKKLQQSNRELEQFAYIASHDLQEPLRMVSSFTQLLEQKYGDKLDDKAKMYIQYSVDGAVRMQNLINDLLEFSRVSTRGKEFTDCDTNKVMENVLKSLSSKIKETNAKIKYKKLPVIKADSLQIERLFMNLIGNAIKFCREEIPTVEIEANESDDNYQFVVKDNGIGIDGKYKEKVFVIFQRLNTREEFQGTGMGLAICKRIVERHNGEIWFEKNEDIGTTFYFNIPSN